MHTDHGHEHGHGLGHGRTGARAGARRALVIAIAITATFAAVEIVGGLLSGSLALVADAGHMLTDVAALALSLAAAWLATRPTGPRRTYGHLRAEILAALVNGVALVGLSLFVIWQAVARLSQPPEVESGLMLVVAAAGLVANLAAGGVLLRSAGGDMNVRGALLHVAGDALGSVGAMGAALCILAFGWNQADPIASILIAVLILYGAWRLVRESTDVLLEAAPRGIDLPALDAALRAVPGVAAIHDVHVWTVTSGFVALSAHAELDGSRDAHDVLDDLTETAVHDFAIDHVTIQPESAGHVTDCHDAACVDPGAGACRRAEVAPAPATAAGRLAP